VVVENKKVTRVSLTPVTRDADTNNVRMLDAGNGDGAAVLQKVQDLSRDTPLPVDGHETLLIAPKTLSQKR
jgi:hypothetical protein